MKLLLKKNNVWETVENVKLVEPPPSATPDEKKQRIEIEVYEYKSVMGAVILLGYLEPSQGQQGIFG